MRTNRKYVHTSSNASSQLISEFTTDLRHLPGKALFRNPIQLAQVTPQPDINFAQLAAAQAVDPETQAAQTALTGLHWHDEPLDNGSTLLCNMSTGRLRPFVPTA